jgi:hypothetical protein
MSLNSLRGENDDIIRYKIKATLSKYDFISMKIYDDPIETKPVPIYVEINKTTQTVTIYPFITHNQSQELGIKEFIKVESVSFPILKFSLTHTNAFLRTFLATDSKGISIYYRLDNLTFDFTEAELSELSIFESRDTNKSIAQKFEVGLFESDTNESSNVKPINIDKNIYKRIIEEMKAPIAMARNTKIKSMSDKLKSSPDINLFYKLISMLYLTNDENFLGNIITNIITKVNSLSDEYAIKVIERSCNNSKYFAFYEVEYAFIKYFSNEMLDGDIHKTLYTHSFDVKINNFITKLLQEFNNVFGEIGLKYSGIRELLSSYTNKFLPHPKNPTNLQTVILSFARKVSELQIDILTHTYRLTDSISCQEKKEFFDSLKNAFIEDKKVIKPKGIMSNFPALFEDQIEQIVNKRTLLGAKYLLDRKLAGSERFSALVKGFTNVYLLDIVNDTIRKATDSFKVAYDHLSLRGRKVTVGGCFVIQNNIKSSRHNLLRDLQAKTIPKKAVDAINESKEDEFGQISSDLVWGEKKTFGVIPSGIRFPIEFNKDKIKLFEK